MRPLGNRLGARCTSRHSAHRVRFYNLRVTDLYDLAGGADPHCRIMVNFEKRTVSLRLPVCRCLRKYLLYTQNAVLPQRTLTTHHRYEFASISFHLALMLCRLSIAASQCLRVRSSLSARKHFVTSRLTPLHMPTAL